MPTPTTILTASGRARSATEAPSSSLPRGGGPGRVWPDSPTTRSTPTQSPSSPAPTADIPLPTSKDRSRLQTLFRCFGDAINFIGSTDEDPIELLAWLNLPHIKPWREQIAAAYRANRELETQRALSRAVRDISRVMDLEADSTLRIRAVTAINRLANSLERSLRLSTPPRLGTPSLRDGRPPQPKTKSKTPLPIPSQMNELNDLAPAQSQVDDELARLSLHLDRRARHNAALEDAKAPLGAPPTTPDFLKLMTDAGGSKGLHLTGWTLSNARGISADATAITGYATHNGLARAFLVTGITLAPPCGSADFNHDGDTGTDQDIEAFFACLSGACCPACGSVDFNADGDVGTDQDIESFFRVLSGDPC